MTERNKLICAARGCDGCNVCNDRDERVTADPVTGEWRAPDRADVAAERDEALKKWTLECGGAGLHVSSLMSSAYRDGWNDARAVSSAVPDGGKGEAVYQVRLANGSWQDTNERAYQYNSKHCPEDTRIVYTAPQAESDGDKK